MQSVYLATPNELGLDVLLKTIGYSDIKYLRDLSETALSSLPAEDSIIITFHDENGIKLIEDMRGKLALTCPTIFFSFSSLNSIERKMTRNIHDHSPIIRFGKGTYHVQMPFDVKAFKALLKKSKPIAKREKETIAKEYKLAHRYREDAVFRHKCGNIAGALRILQGAYYTGDIGDPEYMAAIAVLKKTAIKIPELLSYVDIIQEHADEIKSNFNASSNRVSFPRSHLLQIMLLDDEADTAGWTNILNQIFNKQGYSFVAETNRDKVLDQIRQEETFSADILFLDLMMPDAPEKSIAIVEAMKERFPNVVVIIFSAINDIKLFRHAEKAGAFDYFVKEFNKEDRDPIKYYDKLKWLMGRARVLSEQMKNTNRTRKLTGAPAIITSKVPTYINLSSEKETMFVQEDWISCFAFIVDGVRKTAGIADIEDKRNRLLAWLMRQPADGRGLTLRYIFNPETETLSIAIIGKSSASSQEKSSEMAKDMVRNMSLLFRDFMAYRFISVIEEKELLTLLEPFEVREIVTIQRERLPLQINDRKLTAVYPFSFNEKTYLDNMIRTFMNHDAQLMLNISLWPVDVKNEIGWFQREVQNAIQQFEILNPKGEAIVAVEEGSSRLRKTIPLRRHDEVLASEQELALKLLNDQANSLQQGAFYAKYDVVSGSEIPSMFIETLRYDFFGMHAKMYSTRIEHENLPDVWSNIKFMIHKKPKKNGDMLLSLADMAQAKCVYQFAIPKEEGIRGIRGEVENIIPLAPEIGRELAKEDGLLIAEGFMKNEFVPVHMKSADLMLHLYTCGKSGSGKSTMMLTLAKSLVLKGQGLCLIDPHGDIAADLMGLIPAERRNDVIFFNPADPACKETLNFLENDGTEEQREQIFQEFMNMLLKLYDPKTYMGAMFERLLKITFHTGMMTGLTLEQLPKLWQDDEFRKIALKKLDTSAKAQELRLYWEKELPDMQRNADYGGGMATYISSPLNRFISAPAMKRALSGAVSTINFDDVINNGKILIARLPKGELGEISAFSLGMFLSFRLKGAIMRRGRIPEKSRKEFFFIIDEFQSLLASAGMTYGGDDTAFTSMLSEARKFKVSMILANQYINQLGTGIRSAVFGNIQSKIFFGVSSEDATYIKTQIPSGPAMEEYVSTPNYHAMAQLLVNGKQVGPFTIRTIAPV